MREVRFRAWFKDECIMKEVAINNIYKGNGSYLYLSPMPFSQYKPIELMQYTGAKDRNDAEIYESDILLVDDMLFEVKFSDGAFYGMGMLEYLDIEYYDFSNGEIIGNIYENPELMMEVVSR